MLNSDDHQYCFFLYNLLAIAFIVLYVLMLAAAERIVSARN